jgi:putative transposase
MPWGLNRFHASGQTHFVTFCCYHRRTSFTTPIPRQVFEAALERVRRGFELCVYGYVVMAGGPRFLAADESDFRVPRPFRVLCERTGASSTPC